MPLKSRIASLWRNVVHRDRVDRDLDDEVRTVYSLLVQEKMKRGLDQAQARRAATLELGRIESVEEHVRSVRTGAFLDVLMQDVRYGARSLRRHGIPWPRSRRWLSASAPTPRSSRCSTRCS